MTEPRGLHTHVCVDRQTAALASDPQRTPLKSQAPSLASDDARYRIERKLGEGGAGAVHLAKDLETGEYVAFKQLFKLDAKSVLRLKREFRSLVDINHPHIVKLFDMGRASNGWFLTMEYLAGVDLASYLASKRPAADSSWHSSTPRSCTAAAFSSLRQARRASCGASWVWSWGAAAVGCKPRKLIWRLPSKDLRRRRRSSRSWQHRTSCAAVTSHRVSCWSKRRSPTWTFTCRRARPR